MTETDSNFYKCGEGIDALDELAGHEPPKSALEQLGPSPFPRSGFPLLGFLATLYEHVADSMNGKPPQP
jgi:hypothetical protein